MGKKRMATALLSLFLLLTLTPFAAGAADGGESAGEVETAAEAELPAESETESPAVPEEAEDPTPVEPEAQPSSDEAEAPEGTEASAPLAEDASVQLMATGLTLSGDGTEASPYLIYTEGDLISLMNASVDDQLDGFFRLQNDIAITPGTWQPISQKTAFVGTFDGAGHTVSGLGSMQSTGLCGLFGYSSGTIKNLGVEIQATQTPKSIGALVGENTGEIVNCHATGSISGAFSSDCLYMGGLVAVNKGTISDSWANVAVTGNNTSNSAYQVGGLVARNENGTVTSCYATGAVSGGYYAGGLIGYCIAQSGSQTSTVRWCYATGAVSGNIAGGLIGENYSYNNNSSNNKALIEYSYARGDVTGTGKAGGLVGYNHIYHHYGSGGTCPINYCYAAGVANDTLGGGLVGTNEGYVRYSYYNSANKGSQSGFGYTSLRNPALFYGWDFENIWSISEDVNEGLPTFRKAVTPAPSIEGNGTETSPYLLKTQEHLIALVDGRIPSLNRYFRMEADIAVSARFWTPIGSNGVGDFQGIFDGNGHTISGVSLSNSEYRYIGLFGYNAGTIRNLTVSLETLEGSAYVGGVAAYNVGTIENCTVSGNVTGLSGAKAGGVVGMNSRATIDKDLYVGAITDCASSVAVTGSGTSNGDNMIGGLLGQNDRADVTLSHATGTVSNGYYAGGLIGRNYAADGSMEAVVRYSYATGAVSGNIAGGLIGENYSYNNNSSNNKALIEYSYAQGDVTGTGKAGGLVGYNHIYHHYGSGGTCPINYCYATGVINDGKGGGLVGTNDGYVRHSYYNDQNLGNKCGFPMPLRRLASKAGDVYYSWDFDHIWNQSGRNYPYIDLRGQHEAVKLRGYGDSDFPYLIGTEEELMSVMTGENMKGGYFYRLTADITVTARYWTPIGSNGIDNFSGYFDGDGHTISGLKLTTSEYKYIGLFGFVSGSVSNLNLENVTFEGEQYVGGVAAYNVGTIENCTVSGNVTGLSAAKAGGVVGMSSRATLADILHVGTIAGCASSAAVTGSGTSNGENMIGGLLGQNDRANVIFSHAAGAVSNGYYAGGLIGRSYAANGSMEAVVRYSYATGAVSGNIAGGLIGENYSYNDNSSNNKALIECSYAQGDVTGTGKAGGLVGYNHIYHHYGSGGTCPINYCYATGLVNSGSGAGLVGTNEGYVRYSYYNGVNTGSLCGFGVDLSDMKSTATFYGWEFGYVWEMDNASGYPCVGTLKQKPDLMDTIEEGWGDEEEPYILTTEEQLFGLVTGELPATKTWYKLGNDIVLTANYWTPIGNNGSSVLFSGNLDGDGHTIYGLKLTRSEYQYIGLFGTNAGTIENLKLSVQLEGGGYVGGVAAYNYGTIRNCAVEGTVSGAGAAKAGGLLGWNSRVSDDAGTHIGTVTKCASSATMTGSGTKNGENMVGGLVGWNDRATVEYSSATGAVSDGYYAGGLIGRSYAANGSMEAVVRYSYATGAVSGNIAGGLIGENYSYNNNSSNNKALIEYSYAQGDVTGTGMAGGLVGYNHIYHHYGSGGACPINYCYAVGIIDCATKGGLIGTNEGEITSSYYDSTTSTCTDINRGTPLPTEELQTASSLVGWDFTNDWALTANVNSGYPYLRSLSQAAEEPSVSVSGVTLNKTALALTAGDSETLTATVLPANATNRSVAWTSSDASVASVSNGKVSAWKAGTATITVTTADGSKTASCAVTVTANTVAVTGVTLSKTTLSLTVGGAETLTATVLPANATDRSVTWTSSDASVASVSNGRVTAWKAGTATITVKTADGSKTASCAVTVTGGGQSVETEVPLKLVCAYSPASKTATVSVVTAEAVTLSNYDVKLGWDSAFTLSGIANGQSALFTSFQSNTGTGKISTASAGGDVTLSAGETLAVFTLAAGSPLPAGSEYSFTLSVQDVSRASGAALDWKGGSVSGALTVSALSADSFDDRTNGAAALGFDAPSGKDFTVTCGKPCVVLYSNGSAYRAISASLVRGDTYAFALPSDYSAAAKIVVAVRGDFNGDGELTSTDALQVLRCAAGNRSFDAVDTLISDINGDGELTSTDTLQILRVCVELRTLSW